MWQTCTRHHPLRFPLSSTPVECPMKIGFIGLGAMGFPMARHLSKQHDLLVWNRTREKAERHAREHGTTLADDLTDCAAADVIITMLPTSIEVDEIVDKLLRRSVRERCGSTPPAAIRTSAAAPPPPRREGRRLRRCAGHRRHRRRRERHAHDHDRRRRRRTSSAPTKSSGSTARHHPRRPGRLRPRHQSADEHDHGRDGLDHRRSACCSRSSTAST